MKNIPENSKIGHAHLNVSDLDRSLAFYSQLIGLEERRITGQTALLSPDGDPPYPLMLTEVPNPRMPERNNAGLFHVAIRFPNRMSLANVTTRLLQHRWPLQGASDHGVSWAVYLPDPDGNGIEIYADQPKEKWPRADTQVDMVTRPLDLDALLGEVEDQKNIPPRAEMGTDIGHVHLQASEISKVGAFYHQVIGLNIMQDNFPGALFLAAGDYHHHVGANIWNSRGGAPPIKDSVGLRSYSIELPDEASWNNLRGSLLNANYRIDQYFNYGYALSMATKDLDGISVEIMINADLTSLGHIQALAAEDKVSIKSLQ